MSFALFLAAFQAAPPPVDPILIPPREEAQQGDQTLAMASAQRLLNCMRLAESDPGAAIAEGARWALTDGGIEAELCLGVGHEYSGDWDSAETAYLRAHGLAESADDTRAIGILANAARMTLRKGDAATARTRFDTVLADTELSDEVRGNVLLERAQAHVELENGTAAQTDLIAAQALLPNDSIVWLLSATLARRQGDFDTAGDFIDRALELDQTDPAILLEAGNIAIGLNAYAIAREAWGQAVAAEPESPAGQTAARNIERLDALLAAAPGVPVELPEADDVEPASSAPDAPQP
ncbi:tetratricopeptide repeat protein [Parasphingopyxis sp.]|uniref:tetratricopeptide repeat protein n=1 Tax=Parasphingopyxis sp. TaxID=1920299 RepID=UPI00261D66A5|nr:tetratricopeptide repeat protein [Parasphingopyxis sp.]